MKPRRRRTPHDKVLLEQLGITYSELVEYYLKDAPQHSRRTAQYKARRLALELAEWPLKPPLTDLGKHLQIEYNEIKVSEALKTGWWK